MHVRRSRCLEWRRDRLSLGGASAIQRGHPCILESLHPSSSRLVFFRLRDLESADENRLGFKDSRIEGFPSMHVEAGTAAPLLNRSEVHGLAPSSVQSPCS